MAQGRQILLVEDNPFDAHVVSSLLRRRGHEVRHVLNGRQALVALETFYPHLIISDVMMAEMDGLAFVQSLRGQMRFAATPVIFLSSCASDDDRIQGLRLGADDYLPKPFQPEELWLRASRLLGQSERMRARIEWEVAHAVGPGLRGELSHLGLSTLLGLFEASRKSGVIELSGPATGRLFLRSGRVVAACTDGVDGLVGAEAAFLMLTWTRGTFRYTSCEVYVAEEITFSTSLLLAESARRAEPQPGDALPSRTAS